MNIQINSPLLNAPGLQATQATPASSASQASRASQASEQLGATDAFEAYGLAAELETPAPAVSVWKSVALGGMIALSLGGALAAHPASAATISSSYSYNANSGVYVQTDSHGGIATTARPASMPAPQAPAQTAAPQPVAPPAPAKHSRGTEFTVDEAKEYVLDMLEANDVQTNAQITYENVLKSNTVTLDRISWAIRSTPGAEDDPQLRHVQNKIRAVSDSLGMDFTYDTWNDVLSSKDGWSKKNYETHSDFSGQAQMTDHAIESIRQIMHYKKIVN